MYDGNEAYDDFIRDTTTVTNGISKIGQSIGNLIGYLNNDNKKAGNDFVFTGQSTDLGYFANNDKMPLSMIEDIPDESLKHAIKDELGKAMLDGKLAFDKENNTLVITEKGKEYINRPEFKRAAAENISNTLAETQVQTETVNIELNGTTQDLNFFNHADELNLADIVASNDKEAVQNVLSNLGKMKDSGLVSVSDNVVKITEKGKSVLNSDLFKLASKGAAQGAAEKAAAAAGSVPGVIIVAAKKAVNVAANLIKR